MNSQFKLVVQNVWKMLSCFVFVFALCVYTSTTVLAESSVYPYPYAQPCVYELML